MACRLQLVDTLYSSQEMSHLVLFFKNILKLVKSCRGQVVDFSVQTLASTCERSEQHLLHICVWQLPAGNECAESFDGQRL